MSCMQEEKKKRRISSLYEIYGTITMEKVKYLQLGLAQRIFGTARLGHDELCEGPIPVDFRNIIAGWLIGKKYFTS